MAWVCVLLKMDSAWSRDRLDVSLTVLLLTCHDPDKAKSVALPEIMLQPRRILRFGSLSGTCCRQSDRPIRPAAAPRPTQEAPQMKKGQAIDLAFREISPHRCQYIRGHR
jgi:hypothetical protein